MSFLQDAKTIYQLSVKKRSGDSHEELLDSFYGPQADDYDRFRNKLLPGRDTMMSNLGEGQGVWIDFGGGTASNLEMIASDQIKKFKKIIVVDLSKSLLKKAEERVKARGWNNVEIQYADATNFKLPKDQKADRVTFSYSLTMIPNWYDAVQNAKTLLTRGGTIGIVDFTLAHDKGSSSKFKTLVNDGFWQTWFSWVRVHLTSDHRSYLSSQFKTVITELNYFSPPYMSWFPAKVPYYYFIGKK